MLVLMHRDMTQRYRIYRRLGGKFYLFDRQTGKRESLETTEKPVALRLLHARNEAMIQPIINRQIARAYLMVSDPGAVSRTWQFVMDEAVKLKDGETKVRWMVAIKDRALDGLRRVPLLETNAEHFLKALAPRKVSTNVFLRRIHNFALAMSWLPVPVIPKPQWPSVRYQEKRAVTQEEHDAIVARETHPERKAFYRLAWHLGASQSDIAELDADSIDWAKRIVCYSRKKTREMAFVHFGEDLARVLEILPKTGPLFPYLSTVRPGDRSTEFKQSCTRLGIEGISLHSYRYAWAERAKIAGYPERFAQIALGHNSKAIHRAYARNAHVLLPSLESFEKDKQTQKSGRISSQSDSAVAA